MSTSPRFLRKYRLRLTDSWRPLSELKFHPEDGCLGYDDLFFNQLADRKIVTIYHNGVESGCRIYYRLGMGTHFSEREETTSAPPKRAA